MSALFEPGFGGTAQQWGPNWGLFRPYHLACVEVPTSVARAVFTGLPTGTLEGGPVAELIAVVAMANETNRLADGYRVPVDERFEKLF